MRHLSQDIQYAFRTFLKTPGPTLAAVLALSLGIGANSSVFSVINAVLIRPLSYPNPERLVVAWGNKLETGQHRLLIAPADFRDYREQQRAFETLGAFRARSSVITGGGLPEQVESAAVSPGVFELLGVKMAQGRSFAAEEDQPAHNSVAVLSDRLWRRRFSGSPQVVGASLNLDGRTYTVVGIAPPGFRLAGGASEVWIPYTPEPAELSSDKRGYRSLTMIGRLGTGVSIQQAQSELSAIATRVAAANPDTNAGYGVEVVPIAREIAGDAGPTLWALLGAVTFVLLIACANVANLMLVRAGAREKEMAVRISLGASTGRLVRQLITESILLAVAGGTVGLILAWWATSALVKLTPANLAHTADISIDWRVLAFTLAVSLVTGVVFGLAPAFFSARTDLNSALKSTGRNTSGNRRQGRLRDALVVCEIGSCVVLLIGTGLLLRSLARLAQVDPGFRPDHVLTLKISPPPARYPGLKLGLFYREILSRVTVLPGVTSAGICRFLPLSDKGVFTNFQMEGQPDLRTADQPRAAFRTASPGYFTALGVPLRRGRLFERSDDERSPKVVVINEKAARLFWPDQDPVGRRIRSGFDETSWSTIIGVVGDLKHTGLDAQAAPETYYHYLQIPPAAMNFAEDAMALVVRTSSDPAALITSVGNAVRSVDPEQPLADVKTMQEVVQGSMAQPRFRTVLFSVFAGLALLLAVIGLYGVIAFTVSQRVGELGIRIALGAQRSDILRLIVGQGMLLAGTGIAIGLVLALIGARIMSSLLFEISTADPVTLASTIILILLVALLACLVPAVRATRIDPPSALRAE